MSLLLSSSLFFSFSLFLFLLSSLARMFLVT